MFSTFLRMSQALFTHIFLTQNNHNHYGLIIYRPARGRCLFGQIRSSHKIFKLDCSNNLCILFFNDVFFIKELKRAVVCKIKTRSSSSLINDWPIWCWQCFSFSYPTRLIWAFQKHKEKQTGQMKSPSNLIVPSLAEASLNSSRAVHKDRASDTSPESSLPSKSWS